jgi:hypothetical protein
MNEDISASTAPLAPTLSDKRLVQLLLIAGLLLWFGATAWGGKREAWDSPLYLAAAIPLSIAIAGIAGALNPIRPWRWGALVMAGQALALLAQNVAAGEVGSVLPLGLVAFAVLALPCIGAAYLGARFARRSAGT